MGGAEIADKPDASPPQDRQQRFDSRTEPRIVSAPGVLTPAQLGERDSALGQAFENQIVERPALGKI